MMRIPGPLPGQQSNEPQTRSCTAQLIWTRGDTQERYLWDGVVWPLFAINHDILHLTGPFLFPHDVTLHHSYCVSFLVRGAAQCPLYLLVRFPL